MSPVMTYSTARSAMYGVIKDTVSAQGATIFGYVPEVRYAGIQYAAPPSGDKSYITASMLVTRTDYAGHRNGNVRRYSTVGILVVEVFAALVEAAPHNHASILAGRIREALAGSRSEGVWYRSVTARPDGVNRSHEVFRVIAEFEYTEEGESDGDS